MKLTLVRHGEVEEKYQNKYNGHNDIGLSLRGKEQAKNLAKKLQDLEFDAVFCSDLKRTRETIKPFKQESQAIYTDKLREKSWGRHEGKSFDEIINDGKVKYVDFLQWINELDGEDYEVYINRVKDFFLLYLPSLNKKNILIVTHAGVIRVLQSILHNKTLTEVFSKKMNYGDLVYEDI